MYVHKFNAKIIQYFFIPTVKSYLQYDISIESHNIL